MKRVIYLAMPALLLGLAFLTGCQGEVDPEAKDYANGAFPPILTDMDYHRNSWTRDDCLTCHEQGVNDSPKLEHKSGLVEHLKQAKCRTCHVFVAGAQPRQ
jgi:hypothetical protein